MNLEKWAELKVKTAALSLRERTILLAAALVCVGFIWLQFFYLDFEKNLKQTRQEILTQQQLTVDQSDQLSLLMARLAHDPNAILLQEQEMLQTKLDTLKQKIEQRLSNLIEPELMADVMKNILSDYKGLQLLSVRNLPVIPLDIKRIDKETPVNEEAKAEGQAVLFAHALQMEFEGDYFQTLAFLKRLEEMKGFYWTMLHYQVEEHPRAKIMLQLSTLSLEEGWIGV